MFRTPRRRRLVRDCIEFVADAALYLAAVQLLIVILAQLVRLAPPGGRLSGRIRASRK